MMRLHKEIHPDTDEVFECPRTPELSEALTLFYPKACTHIDHEIRSTKTSNGGSQIRDYCLICGHSLSNPKPKGSFSTTPEYLDVSRLRTEFERECTLKRIQIVTKFSRDYQSEKSAFHFEKSAYLKSDKWKKTRKKVLQRADYICEGCGEKPAEEVHHLTYAHFFSEFLFELVALCPTCHSLIHFEEHPNIRTSNYNKELNILCESCRHQSESNEHKWCGYYNVPSLSALNSERMCNDGKHGFEGLK